MPGQNKHVWTEQLDMVVDLVLAGLGVLMLTLFAGQIFGLLEQFYQVLSPGLLTFCSALAVVVGLASRKMRRGQHDLPQLIRVVELASVAGLTLLFTFRYPMLPLVLSILIVMVMEQIGYDLAHYSEELLFDFSGFKVKGNWQRKWETEGFRLYDRHIIGLRNLQRLVLALDIALVLVWLVRHKLTVWALFGGGLFLFTQFLFLGVGFYQKKRIFWAIQGYEVDKRVVTRMIGLLLVLTLSLTSLAVVLPVNYNPIPWKAIGELINSLFSGNVGERDFQMPAEENTAPDEESGDSGTELQFAMGSSWHTWVFFALIGVVLAFFAAIFLGYIISSLREERYRLQGFSAILYRIYRFFREMVYGWLRGLKYGVGQLQISLVQRREERKRRRLAQRLQDAGKTGNLDWQPQNTREEIIKLFMEILTFFQRNGLMRENVQTLSEYTESILSTYPTVRKEILQMQQLVEEAIYSYHVISAEQVQIMRSIVASVQERVDVVKE